MSDNKNVDIWIAGAFAAFTVDLIVYPLDTIKTRLQSPVSPRSSSPKRLVQRLCLPTVAVVPETS